MRPPADSALQAHSSLLTLVDPIHGSVDVRDTVTSTRQDTISRLLVSPPLQRLRRVKQLDFASHTYPSGDHTRYSHALGTMHLMRKMLYHVFDVHRPFYDAIRLHLRAAYPETYSGDDEHDRSFFLQHMLVAALVQDLGELPYAQATSRIYQPRFELRQTVAQNTGLDISDWHSKPLFTVACLFAEPMVEILDGMHLPLLVYLITGRSSLDPSLEDQLIPLRHMLDGTVDADRLDYVYRDAHHTIGGLGSPQPVIESLLYYDKIGPIMSDPGPVSNFLTRRAHLISTVYHTPWNRFRTLLLITLLEGILQDDRCSREFFDSGTSELSLEDFLELDDMSLTARISRLSVSKLPRRLSEKTRSALNILGGKYIDYRYFWLPPPTTEPLGTEQVALPNDLFFDTLRGWHRSLYDPGSVRIQADSFRYIAPLLPLEECGGPFTAIFRDRWSMVPMPDSILVFAPEQRRGAVWNEFQQALESNRLYDILAQNDPLAPVHIPGDTRRQRGFSGPAIFISFATSDVHVVRDVANELFRRRRRYYLLVRPFQGVGGTPSQNSLRAVNEAEAVLIIASGNYSSRYRDAPDGNIAKEFIATGRRVQSDRLPVVVLSADDFRQIEHRLPWSALGLDQAPFVGSPLRNASPAQIADAVDQVLAAIDERTARGS
jgi:HD superfamily phosphohydrolase